MGNSKVALIGAGAIGSYLIWGFDGAKGVDFSLVAEGERLNRLTQNGVRINGNILRPSCKSPAEAGVQDIVFITTKYSGLFEAIDMLPSMVGPDTLVLCPLNGVDSEEKVAAKVDRNQILHSVMRIASRRTDEGVTFDPEITQGIYFGAADISDADAKIAKVKEVLDKSKANYKIIDDIIHEMWLKYASNVANNLPQAVLGLPAALYESANGYFLAEKLWYEVYLVAKAKGIELPSEVSIYGGIPRTSRYSTLQDLDAGRHTEVDMFAGEMVKMGTELGIEVPYCEYTLHAIKALEEKNDGLFD